MTTQSPDRKTPEGILQEIVNEFKQRLKQQIGYCNICAHEESPSDFTKGEEFGRNAAIEEILKIIEETV